MNNDFIGKKFGRLTVVEFSHLYITPSTGKREKRWKCLCECGGFTTTSKRKLETKHTSSCGCISKTRGGITKSEEYKLTYSVWNMMIQRCTNENFDKDHKYFYRGITVCNRWNGEDGFENFLEDMGKRPNRNFTIERLDVNGNYCKENCIWTDDYSLQAFNQRLKKSNTSGKTGVSFDKESNKWVASIRKKNKKLKKRFETFEEASHQRDVWEIEIYGFLKDNTPRENK